MKGFIHIESTGREGALKCEANLSDVSKIDRYQALDMDALNVWMKGALKEVQFVES